MNLHSLWGLERSHSRLSELAPFLSTACFSEGENRRAEPNPKAEHSLRSGSAATYSDRIPYFQIVAEIQLLLRFGPHTKISRHRWFAPLNLFLNDREIRDEFHFCRCLADYDERAARGARRSERMRGEGPDRGSGYASRPGASLSNSGN